MKRTALLIALLALAGCANLKFQASASYMTDNMAADIAAAQKGAKPAGTRMDAQPDPLVKP